MPKERTPRVLIVDDSQDERTLMMRALQVEGFQCDAAHDGIMAENMLRTKTYDVVVSDLRMPRKHGHQLIVELLARPDPPLVIAVSGLAEPKLVVDLLDRGVSEVIQKPLSYPVLAAKIKALLKRKPAADGESESSTATKVADTIQNTAENLRAQLQMVTQSFQVTIDQLEEQKHQLEKGFLDSLRILSNLISPGGPNQQSHVGRVELLANRIGELAGLQGEQLHGLKFAALLHDIGQFGMPDSVRNKPPWTLNEEELEHFHNYPLIGAALLSEVRGAEMASEIIESHCENFDGSGFPKSLRGREIPIEARILRLADGCDLIRMHLHGDDVIEKLHEHLMAERGRAYDPELIPHAAQSLAQVYRPLRKQEMREVPIHQLEPGMVLAENIYDEHGQFLARSGAEVSELMLARLKRLLHGQRISVHPGHPR